MEKRERNYGIDLLRMVSMFMIVVLHTLGDGGVLDAVSTLTVRGEVAWGLRIACRCAVNCYALISGYVGLHARHKYTSIITLWIQVVGYGVLFASVHAVVCAINGTPISLGSFVAACMPVLHENYWYFSAYFCLFFFLPLLNDILHHISRDILKKTLIAITILFMIWGGVFPISSFGLNLGYNFLWLAVLYFIGGYCAKYQVLAKITVRRGLLGYLACVFALSGSRILIAFLTRAVWGEISNEARLINNYCNFLVVLCAVFLLGAFEKLRMGARMQRVVRLIAPTTFGIYIIHYTPAFRAAVLDGKLSFLAGYAIPVMVLTVLAVAIGIFVFCAALDLVRIQVFRLLRIGKLAELIEMVFGTCIGFALRVLRLQTEVETEVEQSSDEVFEKTQ